MSPAIALDTARLKRFYEQDALDYCSSLALEHFMESTTQSTQRKITVESLDLVSARWPEFQVFSELMIQYVAPGTDPFKPIRVVPDNMVIVHSEPIDAESSFMALLQPAQPILVLEYVSKNSSRKDYIDNRKKYEHDLKVPYYLVFHPEDQDLTVFHRVKGKYVKVKPSKERRLAIADLELEVAILDGWVRFWFRGELLPLPGDMLESLNTEREARIAAEQAAAKAEQATAKAEQAAAKAQQTAAQERTARQALEAELARVKEELNRARQGS